ncbi:MAG: glycosyltransferase family 4 protein [Cyanobacteriota bacterium]|nr:glycosyltransferase family 4 protein [Cyanobacteriota bacterium]
MRPRLAILATHPVQYFVPVFRGLATCAEWETRVFLGCLHGVEASSFDPDFGLRFAWDCDLLSGYDHTLLTPAPLAALSGLAGWRAAPRAARQLLRWKPDAVLIFAYSPAFITAVSLLLALRGVPILLRADTSDEAFDRGRLKGWLRDGLLRWYYRRCRRFYPIGNASRRHYQRLGVPADRLETVLYAVDTSVIRPDPPDQILPPPPPTAPLRLGYVGKFTPVKDPLTIAKALTLLDPAARERLRWEAAGDGPLLEECRQAMEELLPSRCRFHGFLNQSALPAFYRGIDLLILPSIQGEVWGLVVNEALSLGARVLVSDRVGCRQDLVADSKAGWVFRAGDPHALAEALTQALAAWPWPRSTCVVPQPRDLVDAVRRFRLQAPTRRPGG